MFNFKIVELKCYIFLNILTYLKIKENLNSLLIPIIDTNFENYLDSVIGFFVKCINIKEVVKKVVDPENPSNVGLVLILELVCYKPEIETIGIGVVNSFHNLKNLILTIGPISCFIHESKLSYRYNFDKIKNNLYCKENKKTISVGDLIIYRIIEQNPIFSLNRINYKGSARKPFLGPVKL